jgi:hypothetical protein
MIRVELTSSQRLDDVEAAGEEMALKIPAGVIVLFLREALAHLPSP